MLVAIEEFQTNCLAFVERMQDDNEEIVITRSGEPVAKLVPVNGNQQKSVFGFMEGSVTIHGDIVAPLDEKWEADE